MPSAARAWSSRSTGIMPPLCIPVAGATIPGMTDAPSPATLRKWRRRLADEQAEARVYRDLAARRTGEEREILLGLAVAEERHAAHWARLLGDHLGDVGRGATRMRVLAFLARRFGSVFVLALAQRAETRSPYAADADATPAMAADERIHEEVVRGLAARGRARVSGTFRAAVFGANDGLVSNLALVLGVIGGGATTTTVLLTGLSGLLAGALSMGAGEFVSVRSQRELLAASVPDTRDAASVLPRLDVDANELALVYRARGVEPVEADRRAREVLGSDDPAGTASGGRGGRRRGPRGGRVEHGRRAVELLLLRLRRGHPGAAVPVRAARAGRARGRGRARRARAHADRRHRGRAVGRPAAAPGVAPAGHRPRARRP